MRLATVVGQTHCSMNRINVFRYWIKYSQFFNNFKIFITPSVKSDCKNNNIPEKKSDLKRKCILLHDKCINIQYHEKPYRSTISNKEGYSYRKG